jgi:hypothetical protein
VDQDTPEIWLPVGGWEGFYGVSSLGRVRSFPRQTATGLRGGTVLKTPLDNYGRPQLNLCRPGVKKHALVQALVADAFFGPKPPGLEICHWDGNRANCAASNLRYDTHSGNELDKRRHGTHHNAIKTHCPQRHEYTPENTYINPKGSRECRICKRAHA